MKKFLLLVLFFAVSTGFYAQSKEKDELFNKIAKLTQKKKPEEIDKAYQLSKEFLAKFGNDTDEKTKKIQEFVLNYRLMKFNQLLNQAKIKEAIPYGKEILESDPENSYVTMNIAYAGYELYTKNQDKSLAKEATEYAAKTIQLFQNGKLPKEFAPFKDKDEAEALMHYVIATFAVDSDIKQAAKHFYQSIQFNSQIKTQFYPYYVIAFYYEKLYENSIKELNQKPEIKPDDESKIREKINTIIDRMIDAYARAVKLSENMDNPLKVELRNRLIEAYKFRHQTEKGIEEYLSKVVNTPMPDPMGI
ncbi:MAG: hypothetical protein N2Z23_08290 [Pyrinomonadaceae bacterium]|nr:hypothetical protein [Pyrinomonadaceae bacterium]MCX7640419.1 hypothetical protein [Pyrinomonadaceae bacterium]MDW8304846.1 hypothetical protein [Acidobacteriota bacterium]